MPVSKYNMETIIDQLRHFAERYYRYQLVDALTSLEPHTEATIAALGDALSFEDSDVRLLAIQILGELGEKAEAALPAMIEALADESRLVRIAALEPVALFGIKAKDAVPILEQWLAFKDDEFSRVSAAGHIAMIDSTRVAEMSQVLRAAIDGNGMATKQAEWLLKELKSPTKQVKKPQSCCESELTVQQLVTLLREPHPNHEFFDPELNAHTQKQLSHQFSSDTIQHVALGELVKIRAKEAVDDILCLIERPVTSEEIRLHAAQAVFDITGRFDVDALIHGTPCISHEAQ